MIYTRKQFGKDLAEQLSSGYDTRRLSRWAFKQYLDCELEKGLQSEMMTIIAMEEGPEFELTEKEILKLIAELVKGTE